MILLCFVGCDPYVCVAVITLSLGFNGAATMTNLQNSQDLAPNYAGSLYGIINFVGTTSGFISPIIVAHFTAERVRKLPLINEQRVECSLSELDGRVAIRLWHWRLSLYYSCNYFCYLR